MDGQLVSHTEMSWLVNTSDVSDLANLIKNYEKGLFEILTRLDNNSVFFTCIVKRKRICKQI